MAVYKPTYCYPFLNSYDIRVTPTEDDRNPVKYLTCKLDTSNTRITGYKVQVFDEFNNQIFPPKGATEHISPISELPTFPEEDEWINSGYNGTILRIPFFQNRNNPITNSWNAIYYGIKYSADYILNNEMLSFFSYNNNSWVLNDENAWNRMNDGEKVSVGDTFVLLSRANNSGIFQLNEQGTLVRTAPAFDYDGAQIVITKGQTLYNTIWEPTTTQTDGSYGTQYFDKRPWVYYYTELQMFTVPFDDNSNYKWVVVVYQGNGEVDENQFLKTIDYTNLEDKYYDNVLHQGTILGSTPKRLQIGYNSGNLQLLPGEGDSTPIVLKNKYIQIGNYDAEEGRFRPTSERVSIQSFDSALGHIYPNNNDIITDNVVANTDNNAVQIFKYSNNVNEVKAADMVNIATTQDAFMTLSAGVFPVIQGGFSLYYGTGMVIDNVTVQEGDRILVKDRTNPSQNGIYTAHENAYWRRTSDGASYGSFIGKVVLVEQGTENSRHNFESTVNANGQGTLNELIGSTSSHIELVYCGYNRTDLKFEDKQYYFMFNSSDLTKYELTGSLYQWVIDDENPEGYGVVIDLSDTTNYRAPAGKSGYIYLHAVKINNSETFNGLALGPVNAFAEAGSNITFVPEIPMTLFSSLLTYTVAAGATYPYEVKQDAGSTQYYSYPDGYQPNPGEDILVKTSPNEYEIWKVATVNAVAQQVSYRLKTTIDTTTNKYAKILYGNVYSGQIVRLSSYDTSAIFNKSLDLTTASLFHNSTTRTYVSPSADLSTNMRMFLLNNKTVYQNNVDNNVVRFNGVNNKFWYIEHSSSELVLNKPLQSFSTSDSSIPWKYEIRSFFKASDENPFLTHFQPYLKITSERYNAFRVTDTDTIFIPFYVNDGNNNYIQLLTTSPSYASSVTTHFLQLQGEYYQHQKGHWESYRWVLYDEAGEIVQDTGKLYDKTIICNIYGLPNKASKHLLVLYIEDTLGNSLYKAEWINTVDWQPTPWENWNLTATLQCDRQSMLISLENESGNAKVTNPQITIYRQESGLDEFGKPFEGNLEPVVIDWKPQGEFQSLQVEDFNIKSGYKYNYSIFECTADCSTINGITNLAPDKQPYWWNWSLAELIPVGDFNQHTPIAERTYQVDTKNIWLFKYGLETGTQQQNFIKNEVQNLGQFNKVTSGKQNYISGDVSCYLGSEIVCYQEGYVERLPNAKDSALSTNERMKMLQAWRKIAASKNPKLLKDIKGQSWIVQIMSSSNTPNNFIRRQPDQISFSWKQIDDTEHIVIANTKPSITKK